MALSQEMRPPGKPEKARRSVLPRDSRENTALWTLGCWPPETLVRLLANRTVKEKSEFSLCQAPLSMVFSGKNTGMGCHALLQGIFLTQGLNPHLLYLLQWQAGRSFTTSATWEA